MTEIRFDQVLLALCLFWLSLCLQAWHHVHRTAAMPGLIRVLFLRTQGPKLAVFTLRCIALLLVLRG